MLLVTWVSAPQVCDGFSIGTNDLLQLTLGVDRDSGLLGDYDERNPAVRKSIPSIVESPPST
eukprot:6854657-Pyramimonas_sp.AAC.2